MEHTVDAIVLRRRDAGESDRRLVVFTRELGKIDLVARGAKKPTSRLRSISEPLSVARVTFALGRHQKFVQQAQPIAAFRGLRLDYERLTLALAWAEVVSYVVPYEEPLDEAYALCEQVLREIEKHPKPKVALAWAEVALLAQTGFLPSFNECVSTGCEVKEAEAFFSPAAGGYVCRDEAGGYSDRFLVRAEVLYGLAALSQLDAPPAGLRFVDETLVALHKVWLGIVEAALPARTHLLETLMEARSSTIRDTNG